MSEQPATTQAQTPTATQPGLGSAVRTVGGFTLVSRFGGLARDLVTARIVGDSALGSAFIAAWLVPNVFRRLFGEGALSAAFLPEYTRQLDRDPEQAGRLATLVLLALAIVTSVLLIVGEVILLLIVLAAPVDDGSRVLSLKLMMVTLPFMPLVCAAAVLGGVLHAHAKFAPTAAAPLLLNTFV
ncbi:MAG: lipid II flippase MurJ, partial [Planctomycetota bacterium]